MQTSTTPRANVLVLDSENFSGRLLHNALENGAFKASLADDIDAALAALDAEAVDLVLIGVRNTNSSGMEFLVRVRERHRDIPVVMISSNPPVDLVVEAMRAGASDYLDIRNNAEALGTRLERILGARRPHRQADGDDAAGSVLKLPAKGISLEGLERDLVVQALKLTNGNQTRAGKLLGLNRDQIRYRIEKFNLRSEVQGLFG